MIHIIHILHICSLIQWIQIGVLNEIILHLETNSIGVLLRELRDGLVKKLLYHVAPWHAGIHVSTIFSVLFILNLFDFLRFLYF